MPEKELGIAIEGIRCLLIDVKKAVHKGNFEGMKSAFLGGMREGTSWGLRQWLSKNGGALKICNDIELIWEALRKLPKETETTKELASLLRPEAKNSLKKLRNGVPKAYQEISAAHPYLPFFHRLECALKGLSEFDPEDDDVICIDDSDDEEIKEESHDVNVVTTSEKTKTQNSGPIDIIDIDSDDENEDIHQSCSKQTLTANGKFSSCDHKERVDLKADQASLKNLEHSTALRNTNAFPLA